jgi:exopolyphosphatase/guanosine-5'-triphosphate,3'-diphosphate pyrophosphatase
MTLLSLGARRTAPPAPLAGADRRVAIIDIGSNSIRLVVYGGPARAPFTLFNEKIMAGLGASLDSSGRIGEAAMTRGVAALARFAQLCEDMGVEDCRCVATAAVRDAANGAAFVARAQETGLRIEVLSGGDEGRASAHGVLSAIPDADGIMGDLGGGSLELVRVRGGAVHDAISLPLGVLRLPEIRAAGGNALDQRVGKLLRHHGWKDVEPGLPLYMVGGSWRALARLDMDVTHYPLPVLHHYVMAPGRVARLIRVLAASEKARLKAVPTMTASRIPTLPHAAALLSVLARRFGSSCLVTSAYGLREGLLYERLSPAEAKEDPLLIAARVEGDAQGRFAGHGDLIDQWIAPLFAGDEPRWRRIRHAACLLGDVGWRANPEFRAERGAEIALHGNWIAITAAERAVLAQALYCAFGGGGDIPAPLDRLASATALRRAQQWGQAIRLCQRLSGGAAAPLGRSALRVDHGTVILSLPADHADLMGEVVDRRLKQLAQSMGLAHRTEAG